MTAQTVEFGAQLVTFYADAEAVDEHGRAFDAGGHWHYPNRVDVDAQVKVWDALERETWRHKPRQAPFAKLAGMDQELAYQRAMGGRRWSEIDPMPVKRDYGYPDTFPAWEDGVDYAERCEAWDIAYNAWRLTEDAARYDAATAYFEARRAQFAYTGKRQGDKDLLASLVTVAVDEAQAVLA